MAPRSRCRNQGTTAEYRRDPEGVFHDAVKIGGYTENTGDETHDLLLSRERAEATEKAVASMRIDPSRIDVERYGSQHPVASDEEGRARFSVRVLLSYGGGGRGLSLPNVGGGSPSGEFRTGGGF